MPNSNEQQVALTVFAMIVASIGCLIPIAIAKNRGVKNKNAVVILAVLAMFAQAPATGSYVLFDNTYLPWIGGLWVLAGLSVLVGLLWAVSAETSTAKA